jgi:hypothetical protein
VLPPVRNVSGPGTGIEPRTPQNFTDAFFMNIFLNPKRNDAASNGHGISKTRSTKRG